MPGLARVGGGGDGGVQRVVGGVGGVGGGCGGLGGGHGGDAGRAVGGVGRADGVLGGRGRAAGRVGGLLGLDRRELGVVLGQFGLLGCFGGGVLGGLGCLDGAVGGVLGLVRLVRGPFAGQGGLFGQLGDGGVLLVAGPRGELPDLQELGDVLRRAAQGDLAGGLDGRATGVDQRRDLDLVVLTARRVLPLVQERGDGLGAGLQRRLAGLLDPVTAEVDDPRDLDLVVLPQRRLPTVLQEGTQRLRRIPRTGLERRLGRFTDRRPPGTDHSAGHDVVVVVRQAALLGEEPVDVLVRARQCQLGRRLDAGSAGYPVVKDHAAFADRVAGICGFGRNGWSGPQEPCHQGGGHERGAGATPPERLLPGSGSAFEALCGPGRKRSPFHPVSPFLMFHQRQVRRVHGSRLPGSLAVALVRRAGTVAYPAVGECATGVVHVPCELRANSAELRPQRLPGLDFGVRGRSVAQRIPRGVCARRPAPQKHWPAPSSACCPGGWRKAGRRQRGPLHSQLLRQLRPRRHVGRGRFAPSEWVRRRTTVNWTGRRTSP